MRISDWSSDVCSSDLLDHAPALGHRGRHYAVQLSLHGAVLDVSGGNSRRQYLYSEAQRTRSQRCSSYGPLIPGSRFARWRVQRTARRQSGGGRRSEEHTSELQSLMRISYAVFFLKKKIN